MKKKSFLMAIMAMSVLAISAGMASCDKGGDDDGGGSTGGGTKSENLTGNITGARELNAGTVYTITAPVYVTDGATLTIPAGTRIEAKPGFHSYILVLQGGKIFVNGTKDAPVVMTSAATYPKSGDWGGLIINGKGTLAGGQVNVDTEINATYKYGGTVADDDSGTISYLILAYTGAKDSADVEHNGLTLNGVGSGTTIENVYVPYGSDDGIEFFGGSVNVTNLLVVNSDDDMFDFTRGYNGTLKNAYGIWEENYATTETDPSGIEADGNFDGNFADHEDQSDFNVENMTIDIRLAYKKDDNLRRMQTGMMIRRGATANITNALIKGTGRVETLINFTNNKGNGNTATVISLTNDLDNAPDNTVIPAEGYDGVTIGGNNSGCATSIFAWTGYEF